jgi:hypothetical protein
VYTYSKQGSGEMTNRWIPFPPRNIVVEF